MKLLLDLLPIADTSTDRLLAYTNDAHTQLKLKKVDSPLAPHFGRPAELLTFYHEGQCYGISMEQILAAFVAQLPATPVPSAPAVPVTV